LEDNILSNGCLLEDIAGLGEEEDAVNQEMLIAVMKGNITGIMG